MTHLNLPQGNTSTKYFGIILRQMEWKIEKYVLGACMSMFKIYPFARKCCILLQIC